MAWSTMGCGCNVYTIAVGGALTASGSAVDASTHVDISGGVACGGAALVDTDSYVWYLQEQGSGVDDEYVEAGANGAHGTGGLFTSPTRSDGAFCLYAQTFDGTRDYISFPEDTLNAQDLAVSFWVNISSFYKQATIFARGTKTPTTTWVMNIGHTVMRHVLCQFNYNSNGTTDSPIYAFSDSTLEQDRWYHVGVNFENDAKACSIFLDGVLDSSTDMTSDDFLATLENGSVMGKSNVIGIQGAFPSATTGFFEGSLQVVRMYPELKTANWWQAERDNWCSSQFVLVGDEETSTQPLV